MKNIKYNQIFILAIINVFCLTTLLGQKPVKVAKEANTNNEMILAPIILNVSPNKPVIKTETFVIRVTGARMDIHNGDCLKMNGVLAFGLYPDLKCNDIMKPSSGSALFTHFGDSNKGWRHSWTQKNLKPINNRNYSEPSPKNLDYSAVYLVDSDISNASGFGLKVTGNIHGCHKPNDFGEYTCSNIYTVDGKKYFLSKAKFPVKETLIITDTSDEHKIILYLEIEKI
jgi:uncharacterized protein YycO